MSRSAATILPMAFSPGCSPNASPMATRTAGAIWNTTRLFLSCSARHTRPMSLYTVIAAVGHTAAHWPQPMQSVSASFWSNAGITRRSALRCVKSMMFMPWISSHVRTQSPQRMHLFGSRTTEGLEVSSGSCSRVSSNRTRRTPKRSASRRSSHALDFSQTVQSRSCEASRSSMIIRRYLSSRAVLVWMESPSRGSMEQEASMRPLSSSTTHIRHAP